MRFSALKKSLGPGILFASTAIGVSHLVQSTRAGADYGFALIWAILLANILKYPFFEYGSRYANVRNRSILHGYVQMGKPVLFIYVLVSFLSMFVVSAAVSFVCSGLLGNLLGLDLPFEYFALALYTVCAIILLRGSFGALDGLIKAVAIILLISTVAAWIAALIHGPVTSFTDWPQKERWGKENWIFIIALMGWMPTAVDMSAWNSIWTIEKIKQSGYHPSLRETLFEFRLGYWISAGLSICFLTLGAYFMFGTGHSFSNSGVQFAAQLIDLFTSSIGDWSKWIIAIAAFSVMFSTTITVFDGYARALSEAVGLLRQKRGKKTYRNWLVTVMMGSFILLMFFVGQLKNLVDLATITSFLIAPLIAIFNYKLIFGRDFPEESRPNNLSKWLAWSGIAYLLVFSGVFLWLYFN
jgi:Mn2+/Fe2+ NRAMP family transporter